MAFVILIVSVLITSPINISREVLTLTFNLNDTNTSITLYTYGRLFERFIKLNL